jgi:tryptophanyl-tRNA synthetase
MGRIEHEESADTSQIFYPCMQCADILFFKVHFTFFRYINARINE